MTALSIQPTFPIFTDIDGQPLENGYIWIGTANLDPQTNPINVYWDEALTISAPQPIRTLAGYPSRNGTPGRLYVNSLYSIRVQNRNGSNVYSAPTPTEEYAGLISPFNGNFEAERFTAGFGTAADYPKAGLHINKTATNHAHYGVLDNTVYNFTGSTDPLIGNASYNDNTNTQGSLGFDHHHSYQSYPHVNMSAGTISVLSSFWALHDVVTGTVAESTGLKVNNPSGAGTITNLYGVKIENLTRGTNNWAVFSAGNATPSYFGGGIEIGRDSTSYGSFKYATNGTVTVKGRNDSGGFPIRLNTQTVRLGIDEGSTDFDVVISNSVANGNLEITPRDTFGTHLTRGNLGLGVNPALATQALQIKRDNDSASIILENTGGPNKWQISPAFPGVANTGFSLVDTLAASNKTRFHIDSSGNSQPGADNVFSMGVSGSRWSVIYAATGTINTSDAREKTVVSALTSAEIEASKDLAKEMGTYKFLNAVAEKGDKARMHAGMTVQRAIEIMTSHGLQPTAYAFICHDSWDDLYENIQTNVGEKVKAVRQIERQKSKQTERKITEIKMVDGKAVACTSVQISEEMEFSEHLVFNEDGTPLMYEASPAVAAIYNDEGNLLHPAVAATYEQVVHREPVIEIIDQEYEVDAEPVFEKKLIRPAGDRYSFRPDELLMFIAKGIDARISAIETKTA